MGGAVLGGWSQPSPAQKGSGSPCWARDEVPLGWPPGLRLSLSPAGSVPGAEECGGPRAAWARQQAAQPGPLLPVALPAGAAGGGGLTSGLGRVAGDKPSSGQRARGGWLGLLLGFGFQAQLEPGVVPRPVPSLSLGSILHPLLRGAFRTQQPLPLSAGGDVVRPRGEWGQSPPWVLPPETSHGAWGHLAQAGGEQGLPRRAPVGKRHQCVEKQK